MLLMGSVVLFSCRKELKIGVLDQGDFGNRGPGLKDAFNIPIGTAISYGPYTSNSVYTNIANSDFDIVTFEWDMKHRAIVQDNGSFNFSRADQLVSMASAAGLKVFGHTLVWHQNQNGNYLKTLTAGGGSTPTVNLLSNPGFESGLTGWTAANTGNPAGSSPITVTTTAGEFRSGTSGVKVVTNQNYGTSQWRVQLHTPGFAAQNGKTYNVTFWIKAANPGGSVRLSAAPTGAVTNAYQGDQDGIGTDWTPVSWSITMTGDEANQKISFDLGKVANTYFIDDIKVFDPAAPPPPPLLANGGFENGMTGWTAANTGNPAGSSPITLTTSTGEFRSGTSAVKVVTNQNYGTSQWRVQLHTPGFAAESGKTYNVSFWIRAATAGGSVRLSAAPTGTVTNAYQGDQDGIGTGWTQVSWSITMNANEPNQKISFDLGKTANTYFIDDVAIADASIPPPTSDNDIAEKVDEAMESFITAMVTRYKPSVKAWDVVNEALVESGNLRTSSNTTISSTADASDYFFWADYLGRDFALKAFQYAAAADPDALLFINDYNLETNATKLDSTIAYVNQLKAKGAKIDGIGTQMHVSWNTPRAGIDAMFKKLAATGLLVRISELDVRVNPNTKQDFEFNALWESYQASMYEYVIQSYLKHVPAAQQHGITIWGVTDNHSWLYNDGKDHPLLYKEDGTKKAAYGGVLNGVK